MELIEVGPAHTKGDVIVHVPDDGVVYTGDILFVGGHPVVWEGPVSNWIAACRRVEAMDVHTVVPGHGPLATKADVARMREYLEYLAREARSCFDAGLDVATAARAISLADYAAWGEAERIVVNVDTLYREFGAPPAPPDPLRLLRAMGEYGRR